MSRAGRAVVLVLGLGVAVAPFFWATTFFTDDHLLLAFARYAPNPLVAFLRDQHGGEFYRPLSMSLWWLMARIGHGTIWPFALVAAGLHLVVAGEIAALVLASSVASSVASTVASTDLPARRAIASSAALFFFLALATRETALWFAAFPDLLATALVLGALLALVAGRPVVSTLLGVAAYLTKESAVVLPALGALLLVSRGPDPGGVAAGRRSRAAGAVAVGVQALLALAYLLVRRQVLGGWGGSGDQQASAAQKLVQIAGGLVGVVAGVEPFPEAFAWGAGGAVLAVAIFAAGRRLRGGDIARSVARNVVRTSAPLVFTALAVVPLFGASWIVGARYFYLPSVGLAWLVGELAGRASSSVRVAGALLLLMLGLVQTLARHDAVASYDRKVGAARRAVVDGVGQGHRIFHVAGGIKDLDLAVKEAPALRAVEDQLLVLGDVPASFVALPEALAGKADFLIAQPPLPPSGAYRFGARRVVGLARRGDEPTLDELVSRFPDVRFIRLRPTPMPGHVIARDVTEEIRSNLD